MSREVLQRCESKLTALRVREHFPTPRGRNQISLQAGRGRQIQFASSHAVPQSQGDSVDRSESNAARSGKSPIGQRARQAQADKEFFADLLSSAATKRDAKAYISRLRRPARTTKASPIPPKAAITKPPVNLGNLFSRPRAAEHSPKFAQHVIEDSGVQELETLHIALIKVSDIGKMSDATINGICQTLSQLARLSMVPCIVLDSSGGDKRNIRHRLTAQAEKLAFVLQSVNGIGARILDNVLAIPDTGIPRVSLKKLLMVPLRSGQIPIVIPLAYSESRQQAIVLTANEVMMTLTKGFSKQTASDVLQTSSKPNGETVVPGKERVSLDRIILINESGGVPNSWSADGKRVFVNLAQDFDDLQRELLDLGSRVSPTHLSDLVLLKEALEMLPHSSSGLITTPSEAANVSHEENEPTAPTVGTRRQKNTLIHNLLTDKPAFSASLPRTRLTKTPQTDLLVSVPTFVKRGMPVTIIPNPYPGSWTPETSRVRLTDPSIDLKRLVHLIDDSFNRQLDVDAYLGRVNDRIAGVIVAGDYEGGAILTWETPPGVDPKDASRLVPYLDKFAVLKRSQGSGGVADIVFNEMVRTCFPDGVCWRSRKNNPVNKWYFERSVGTWKIPDMNWTMFWTTPGVSSHAQVFKDYESVCRGIVPTWMDKEMAPD